VKTERGRENHLPPVVSVVGRSGSGKTVFLEKLIAVFKRRGLKIGTIKHHLHDFEIDQPGKDSSRHARAGSDTVIISSPKKVALIKRLKNEMSIDQLVRDYMSDLDLVLTEGYKSRAKRRVEVYRNERGGELVSAPEDLLAVVTDTRLDLEVPQFGLDEAASVADLITQRVLGRRQ
jgi:molybdopterin-guanine dinucleotide biosynthesis protein B